MTTKNIRYGSNSLFIKKFDIKSMPDFVTIAMIAKRASGKSYLTKEEHEKRFENYLDS